MRTDKTWTVEEERLTDGSTVFNVMAHDSGTIISLPCENWRRAGDLAELLNAEAPTINIYCQHGE